MIVYIIKQWMSLTSSESIDDVVQCKKKHEKLVNCNKIECRQVSVYTGSFFMSEILLGHSQINWSTWLVFPLRQVSLYVHTILSSYQAKSTNEIIVYHQRWIRTRQIIWYRATANLRRLQKSITLPPRGGGGHIINENILKYNCLYSINEWKTNKIIIKKNRWHHRSSTLQSPNQDPKALTTTTSRHL